MAIEILASSCKGKEILILFDVVIRKDGNELIRYIKLIDELPMSYLEFLKGEIEKIDF